MAFGIAVGEGFVNGQINKLTIVDLGPGDGIFLYSPSIGPNNLVASFTAAPGFDASGNEFLGGSTSYGFSSPSYYAIQQVGLGIFYASASSQAGPWSYFGSLQVNTVTPGDLLLTFNGIVGTINVPQGAPSITTLPADGNSGSTWVSGERAFMNNNWVTPINNNFAAIVAALTAAGIVL